MNPSEFHLWVPFSVIASILAMLVGLTVVASRELIKCALREKLSQVMSIRWRPFALACGACTFEVLYTDFTGLVHRARCRTYWPGRAVRWDYDEIVGSSP